MESIFIAGTRRTPEISLKTNGFLSINGVSIPEDANEFYSSTLVWLEKLEKIAPENINLKLNFVYMNTTSTSIILKILRKVYELVDDKNTIKILWTYEEDDDDMLEQGKILQKLIGHPFQFESKNTM